MAWFHLPEVLPTSLTSNLLAKRMGRFEKCYILLLLPMVDGNSQESSVQDTTPRPQAQPMEEGRSGTAKEKPGFPMCCLRTCFFTFMPAPTPLSHLPSKDPVAMSSVAYQVFIFGRSDILALTRHFQSSWSPLKC